MIFDWMDCAAILSARNVLEGETFRAFVINELTEEVLEQHAFTPLKNRLGQYEWVSDFCRFINNRS
ncbi:MAG: hypothetical protein ACN6QH_20515, partial [Pseudomonas sp.]|uniref:hypothetical protein n=1 Tax=Pseudomonas sp. TaxID=306 RepID=UPI003D124089